MIEQISTLDIDFSPAIQGSEKTERTLNDLREEIKKLKTSLGETAIESEDFGKTLNTINDKQNELKELTQVNVSESAKLRKEFKQLKDELLTLEEGTEEYNDKLKQAAEISQRLQDVNEFVKASASDLGDHLENLTGAFAGVTGSIQMVQGAMNLMGVESEVIEKAIAKLQGLMAITEGLKAIEGAIDPFKRLTTSIKLATAGMSGFKKALIGTGIGAIVVLLGTLIAHWDDVTKALGFANTEQEGTNRLLEEQKNRLDNLNSALDTRLKKMQLYGDASQKELEQEKLKTYQNELVQVEKLIRTYEGWINSGKKLNDQQKESYENALSQQKILKGNILDTELALKKITDKEKEDSDKQAQQALNEQQRIEQERRKQLKDNQRKEIELFNLGIEEKKILYGDEWTATYEYIEQMKTLYDMKKKFYEDDEVALKEVMNEELAFLKENLPEQVQEIENTITGLDMSGYKPTPALLQRVVGDEEQQEEQQEETKTRWENFIQQLKNGWDDFDDEFDSMSLLDRITFVTNQIGQVGNSINSLLGSLSEDMDKNSQEYKNNQIAQIVISTITGVATAIASAWQLGPIAGAIVGPINAAATLASGITAIKKLQSGTPSLSDMGSGSNMMSSVNPSVANQSALESLSQGVNYTNMVQGSSTEETLKDTRVYVLESDISRTQKNVSVIESESTY